MFVFPVTHLEAVIGTHNVMAAPVYCRVITATLMAWKLQTKPFMKLYGQPGKRRKQSHPTSSTPVNKQPISCKRGKKFRRRSCPRLFRTAAFPARIAGRAFDGFLIFAPATGRWGRLTPVIPTVDLNQRRNLHLNPPLSPQVPARLAPHPTPRILRTHPV